MADRNCLSQWYPKLAACGVRTPATVIVETEDDLTLMLDGDHPSKYDRLCKKLRETLPLVGGPPAFLRTGHGSGKHEWTRTCCVTDPAMIPKHVAELVEWSATVDMMGLPTNVWAVREFLYLYSPFHTFRGMPIARERRYFIRDGVVECHHPYWPEAAIAGAYHPDALPEDWRVQLKGLNHETGHEIAYLTEMSQKVARRFEGYWSLDWARTKYGEWYAIDMAEGERSWHPPCKYATEEQDCYEGEE